MEKESIMDRKYGKQEIPKLTKAGPIEKKYWGWIQTITASDDFTLKRIFMKAGSQSSMEYHVYKDENYFIEQGKLKLGLRIGRAKNISLILNELDTYNIPPGLMHMRMALEDTIIIEWSNKDDDSDSNIVEDGKTYQFKETD